MKTKKLPSIAHDDPRRTSTDTPTKTTHTPGPWEIGGPLTHSGPGFKNTTCINTPHGCAGALFDLYGEKRFANARLIAAAPELLAAAKKFIKQWNKDNQPISRLINAEDKLKLAIAKAEGL